MPSKRKEPCDDREQKSNDDASVAGNKRPGMFGAGAFLAAGMLAGAGIQLVVSDPGSLHPAARAIKHFAGRLLGTGEGDRANSQAENPGDSPVLVEEDNEGSDGDEDDDLQKALRLSRTQNPNHPSVPAEEDNEGSDGDEDDDLQKALRLSRTDK